MDKIISILPVNQDPFLVTWDLGRRCNYDCSYCPAHRHDNFSPHASLQDLIQTTDFLFEYISIIAEQRINKDFHVSFTGGEPTVNPNFSEFSSYIKNTYLENHANNFNLKLDLTTNGAMSEKVCNNVIKNFDFVTISFHVEAHEKLKAQVKSRILELSKSKIKLKVNVMLHAGHFDECKEFCEWLDSLGVKFIPRLIGEDPNSPYSQAHLYTDSQKEWLKKYWKMDISSQHRPCCGGRTFAICSSSTQIETQSVNFREFKNWNCSVNWFFLHIEQQTDSVFHHQTCQAKFDGSRGSIGYIRQSKNIISNLKNLLDQKKFPIITCPNKLCGCGLCTPKSKKRHDLLQSMPLVVKDISIFNVDLPN